MIFDIMELIRGNRISDDTDIDERQVEFHLNNARAMFLRQEYNRPGRVIDHNLIQDLGCVELEQVDPADCCDIETGCHVLRTVETIPQTLEFYTGPAITRVGSVNKLFIPFSFISYDQVPYAGSGKYNKNAVFMFLLNHRLHLITNDKIARLLDYINIQGVFENPNDAEDFSHCDGEACYSGDSRYPINAWMYPIIRDMVLEKFGISLKIPKDMSNDAKEDLSK